MKLYGSHTSPFVQKCRITALESGLSDQIELIGINVLARELNHPNPLGYVPALETESGELIVDSRVICDYLEERGEGMAKTPDWSQRTLLALADGLTDRAVSLTLEKRRPKTDQSDDWIAHCEAMILKTLPELSRRIPDQFHAAAIALYCSLAYLDLRHDHLDWRDQSSALTHWFDVQKARPSILATEPPL